MKPLMREYAVPAAVTVLLHAVMLFWLGADFTSKPRLPEIKDPPFIKASVVQLKEQKTPQPKPAASDSAKKAAEQKKREEALKKQQQEKAREQERQKQARLKAEQEKQQKLAREKQEKARLEKERAEQQQRERERQAQLRREEEQRKAREEALLQSFAEQQAELQSAQDEVRANSYISVIQQAVIANWSRPASARNDMQAVLEIQLVPTGAVVDVKVIQGSGNDAFDRSAVAAVKKAERFPELAGMEPRLFEKYFRRLKMRFKPEDLRL